MLCINDSPQTKARISRTHWQDIMLQYQWQLPLAGRIVGDILPFYPPYIFYHARAILIQKHGFIYM